MEPICAPATPLLRSSIAVIKASGDGLGELVGQLVELPEPRRAVIRRLKWAGFSELALVLFFPSPNSYTGEDVVEFHIHGNPLLAMRLLEFLGQIGIRLAQPGEFTKRALLNGKQSLLDAEALKDLVDAATDAQLRQAQARSGGVPTWVSEAKAKIASWVAKLEACVDYGEDEGASFDMHDIREDAEVLGATFHVEQKRSASARWLRDGIKIAIAGRPNAGKSTLFNALADEDRAIVSVAPGTTRDILEARCEWAGLPLLLFDVAGIRETKDPIEKLGIAKIAPVLQKADLILHLVPAPDGCPDTETTRHLSPYSEKVLIVHNQCDLAPAEGICISAKNGILGPLENALKHRFLGEFAPDACLGALATERQRELLADLADQMGLLAGLPDGVPFELPASLLQGALGLLARLTGEDRSDLSMDAMFSEFCLGK
jgi:tRNA modification GTPase